MLIVAAYTRASNLPSFEADGPGIARGTEEENFKLVMEHRKRAREKRLVGFVRVSGDSTLVRRRTLKHLYVQ